MDNYIFGTGQFAIEVKKILEKFGFQIKGFLKLDNVKKNQLNSSNNSIPIYYADKIDLSKCNIIIAKKPMIMGDTIGFLKEKNCQNVYSVSEDILFVDHFENEDISKFFRKIDFEKPFLNYLEMNVVDQCNLNCKGCAHFSNICDNNWVSIDKFKRDLILVNEKFDLYYFRLLGGEPLLHPKLAELIRISHEVLKETKIVIVTNGLLISKLDEKTLQTIADNNVLISISLYEPTNAVLDEISFILKKYNIKFIINDDFFSQNNVIDKFQTRLSTERVNDGEFVSKNCIGRFCRFLRDGKISKCYYPLLIDILNKKYKTNYAVTDDDFIDIASVENGWQLIEKLNKKIPFCDYCSSEVYEFNWEAHHKNDNEIDGYIVRKR